MIRVKTVREGVVEICRNKRKGLKLKIERDLLGYPCLACCLKDRFCKNWAMVHPEAQPCLMIEPGRNEIYFEELYK